MSTVEEWSSTIYATNDGMLYTLHTRQQQFQAEDEGWCTLVAVTIADGSSPLQIPCFNHQGFCVIDHYFCRYTDIVADELCYHFPDFPESSAVEIALIFMEKIVRHAATNHRFPLHRPDVSSGVNVVIEIHPDDDQTMEELVISLREYSFEEEIETKPKPATADSVQDLLAAKCEDECKKGDQYENGWIASEHECVICTDEIPTRRSSLAMECSHAFHEDCLLQWLKITHVCPLCRYEMPYDVL